MSENALNRVAAYLGLERMVLIACVAFFILNFGTSLWLTLFAVYLDSAGLTTIWIGAVLTGINASISLTYLPSGRLSDLVGRRAPLVAGSALIAINTLFLYFTKNPLLIMTVTILYGIGQGLATPAVNALVAESSHPSKSGMAYASYYISILSATVLGSGLSGLLAGSLGFQSLFLIASILLTVATVVIYLFVKEVGDRWRGPYHLAFKESLKRSISGTAFLLRTDRELRLLAVALSFHAFGFYMLNPYIALYATYGVRLDVVQTGVIIALWNMGMISTQIPFGRMTDKLGGEPMLFVHFVLSTLSWVAYTLSKSFIVAATTMILFGIIGAMDMPARRTIMLEHATGDAGKATIIGVVDSITTGVGIVAPLIGAIAWAQIGYSAPFMIGAAVNVFACFPMLALLRRRRLSTSR